LETRKGGEEMGAPARHDLKGKSATVPSRDCCDARVSRGKGRKNDEKEGDSKAESDEE